MTGILILCVPIWFHRKYKKKIKSKSTNIKSKSKYDHRSPGVLKVTNDPKHMFLKLILSEQQI